MDEKRSAVQEAVSEVLGAISEADGRTLVSRRKPKEAPAEEAPAQCEACASGQCDDPDHASDDELAALEG